MLRVSLYWMSSIRLVDLMTRPDEERKAMTLKQFASKFTYFFLPVSANPNPRPLRQHLLHLAYHAGLFVGKIVASDFLRTWFLRASLLSGGGQEARHNYWLTVQMSSLFALFVLATSASNELQILVTSAVTRDRYEVLAFNDWPLLATSFRELWGVRYNRLVNSLLRESVFTPLQRELHVSKEVAALAVFAVSGALHAHVAHVCFGGGIRDAIYAFSFFAIHGLFCVAEARMARGKKQERNPLLGALITQVGVALTAPLYLGLFVYASPAWVLNNPSDFRSPIEVPVPRWLYCPKP